MEMTTLRRRTEGPLGAIIDEPEASREEESSGKLIFTEK